MLGYLLVRVELGFYPGCNVLVLIRVKWPNRGLSEGLRKPLFFGNHDECAKRFHRF